MRLLGKALTFDDVLLVPAFSQVLPKDTSLATRLSRNITLNLPLVSAAMDTVTEARLAIAIAQEGGIGIVHKNLTAAAAGRRGGQGQALRIRRAARPGGHHARRTPCAQVMAAVGPARHLGLPGGRRRQGGRHRHRPRPALRDPLRRAGQRDHDAAREAHHRARRHHAGRGQGAAQQAQARAPAGDQRRLGAQGPDHRQGHHQADQLPQRRARRRRAACAWARRSAWARAPRSASRRW